MVKRYRLVLNINYEWKECKMVKTYPMTNIHETAVIKPGAKLGKGVEIGSYSVIGSNVEIGTGTRVGSYSYIEGWTKIGENNKIGNGDSIGLPPQNQDYEGEKTYLRMGNNNIIRDYVTIHRGSSSGRGKTLIGNNNLFRVYSHVAYDCQLGDHIILSNSANLANNVNIDDYASIAKLVGVHQDVRIGQFSMIETHSKLIKDLPPYVKASGHPARVEGLNKKILQEQKISVSLRRQIEKVYDLLYNSELNMSQALRQIKDEVQMYDEIRSFVKFIENSERGICA